MKTKDFARVLSVFADVADFDRSAELHQFARFFDQGVSETMLARLKRLHPSNGHPANLKLSIASLHLILKNAGAKKQAQIVGLVLALFAGRGGTTVEAFVAEISSPTDYHNVPAGPLVDVRVANAIIEQLQTARLDDNAFDKVLSALRSPRDVSVSTLAHIARRLIGDKVSYRDRKTAVRAIARHYRSRTSDVETGGERSDQMADIDLAR